MQKMAQPSIADYFGTRKRPAADEFRINRAKKVLILDQGGPKAAVQSLVEQSVNKNKEETVMFGRVSNVLKSNKAVSPATKKLTSTSVNKGKEAVKQGSIEQLFNRISSNAAEAEPCAGASASTSPTPQPRTPTKSTNAMDKVKVTGQEPSLNDLKVKLSRSSRLAELRASIGRLKQYEEQLSVAKKQTNYAKDSIALKNFSSIELEVNLSPQKPQSPQKAYLSPKKDTSACKNLFNVLSPTKNAVPMPSSPDKHLFAPTKEALALPYKYRRLAEIFRSIDTVCQILYNRKEVITFRKLKPAVEEMLKRNLTEKHLAQIKHLYPEAFILQQEKLREFGTGTRREQWELVVTPQTDHPSMTAELLLDRRRKMHRSLIEKLTDYHQEFLQTLEPPMKISRENITRWHPQFDVERVPEIEEAAVPQPPSEETFTTGSQVLERARLMFNCNTRMERALEKLKERQEAGQVPKVDVAEKTVLKGIPKALLEKVRQKQAAKALESMTRSSDKEKEVQLYSKLPEIARLTRNLFVSEKKNVLPLELVLDKLCHSYRAFANRNQMEEYLKMIGKEVDKWLKFEEVRSTVFIKLAKNHDLSLVMSKLQTLADQKMTELV